MGWRHYVDRVADDYTPMMSEERVKLLRVWHDRAYQMQRASLPA
jgi:hypothetical protein